MSVIVSDFGELKETVSTVEFQYVQVLAVTAGTGLDTDEYENTYENTYKRTHTKGQGLVLYRN